MEGRQWYRCPRGGRGGMCPESREPCVPRRAGLCRHLRAPRQAGARARRGRPAPGGQGLRQRPAPGAGQERGVRGLAELLPPGAVGPRRAPSDPVAPGWKRGRGRRRRVSVRSRGGLMGYCALPSLRSRGGGKEKPFAHLLASKQATVTATVPSGDMELQSRMLAPPSFGGCADPVPPHRWPMRLPSPERCSTTCHQGPKATAGSFVRQAPAQAALQDELLQLAMPDLSLSRPRRCIFMAPHLYFHVP